VALLRADQIVAHSLKRDVRFRVVDVLGEGGFGQAYTVVELDEDDRETTEIVCMKVTTDPVAWHGETYFMSLLSGNKHAMEILDSFPLLVGEGQAARMRFAITMPIMPLDVAEACETNLLPWSKERVARQVRLMLEALAILHGLKTPHRDITPMNVFIGPRNRLVLGDYGITKTALLQRGVKADQANWAFAPPDLKTYWDVRDDIYQVGLLCATLLTGQVWEAGVKKPEINKITSDGPLRNIIKTALSVKSQRYADASEMAAALALV
jgi:serine/threonine protein kinase